MATFKKRLLSHSQTWGFCLLFVANKATERQEKRKADLNTWRLLKEADPSGFFLEGERAGLCGMAALAGWTSHISAKDLLQKFTAKQLMTAKPELPAAALQSISVLPLPALDSPLQGAVGLVGPTSFTGEQHAVRIPCSTLRGNDRPIRNDFSTA